MLQQLPLVAIPLDSLLTSGGGLEPFRLAPREVDRLAASIRERGLVVPPLVWAVPDTEPQQYVIVDGGRRVMALKRLRDEWDLAAGPFPIDPVNCSVVSADLDSVRHLAAHLRLNKALQMHGNRGDEAVLTVHLMQPPHSQTEQQLMRDLKVSQPWASVSARLVERLSAAALRKLRMGEISQKDAERLMVLGERDRRGRVSELDPNAQTTELAEMGAPPAKWPRRKRKQAAGSAQ